VAGGQRDIIDNFGAAGPSKVDVIEAAAGEAPASTFKRGVVAEIFYDLAVMDEETLGAWSGQVENPDQLAKMPRNSIAVRIISDNEDKQSKARICYPFFPPYLCFPIKCGEQVWVMSEGDDPTALMFWMCRIPEAEYIDDLNYTHGDRRYQAAPIAPDARATVESTLQPDVDLAENDALPGFPNGGGTDDSYTLHAKLEGADSAEAYEEILENSIANDAVTFEPVPRFTKRPGDLVFQGSNNTLICLGEDRGYNIELVADSAAAEWSNAASTADGPADPNERAFAGTIDIVAGRGRTPAAAPGDDPELTGCRTIVNAREYEEVDKNPVAAETAAGAENRFDRPSEGDPDFMKDSSRLYISMKTDGDANFGISNETGVMVAPFGAHTIDDMAEVPYIIAKSDEIRIIARKNEADDPTGYPEVNGSIRIIKEGAVDDDLATILLLPDGTIQISGSLIYLGRHADDGGEAAVDGASGTESAPGEGDSQPWVKYQQLDDLLTAIMEDIKTFALDLQTNFNANTTPGYGAPNPSLITAASAECQALQDNMDSRIAEINTIKSARIFGE